MAGALLRRAGGDARASMPISPISRIFFGDCAISKPHTIKLNSSRPGRLLRDRGLLNVDRCIQQFEHPLSGRHCRLQNVVLLAQILNRPEKTLRILNKGNQNSNGDRFKYSMKWQELACAKSECHLCYLHVAKYIVPAEPDH